MAKERLVLFILVAIVSGLPGSNTMCATLQYLELFQSGTVQCAFEEGYLGIQWYDSTTIGTPPIITFVKSVKGGSGYLSREYDVYPNGSLIINNVTLHHERIFSVSVAASEDEPIKDWYIQVKSEVTPVLSFPVIERCEDQPNVCLFVNNQLSSINCVVENVRPTVSLAWYQRISNHDQLLTAWSNVTASQGNTFTSLASLQLARELPLLSVFVCKVEDNKWLFNEDEAVAILEGQDVDPKDNPVKQYFEVNSEMTLSCNEGNVVIWKRSLDVDGQTEVILISINNWKNSVNQTYNQDYRLGSNGSLILHRPKWHHAGLYICLSSDSNAEHIRIYNVLIFKSPNPPHIIIEGCTPPQSCVLEVKQEGNITCSVLGIRPEVELMWKSQYDTNDFSLSGQEVKSNEREGSFDVFLSGNFKFEATFADEITLECLVVGSNADLFHMSTKVKLIPKFEETSDSKRKLPTAVLILTVLALVIIITMAVLLVLFKVLRRKPRKQDGHNAEETAPMINFQNVTWRRYGYRLNLRSGDWKVDDPRTVSRLCSEMIEIRNEHSYLLQKCTIELLLNASKCNISISDLWLINSFRTTDGVYIILRSKLRLACPSSVEKLWIQEDKNEITETSCLEIMKFVQQSKQIKELVFYRCLVPRSISPESVPTTMKSGNKKVSWNPKQQYYNLNVNSGRWFNQRSEKEMTDEEYADITSR